MRRVLLVCALAALLTPALAIAGRQQFPTFFAAIKFNASASKVLFKGTLFVSSQITQTNPRQRVCD